MMQLFGGGDVHRAGEGVVGGLAEIAMVVRMHRRFCAERRAELLIGEVGDDFVGVHVGLRARAGLPHDQRKMRIEFAIDNLLRALHDGVADFFIHQILRNIHPRRTAFNNAQRANHRARHPFGAYFEVLQRSLRLRAPIFIRRHFNFAK